PSCPGGTACPLGRPDLQATAQVPSPGRDSVVSAISSTRPAARSLSSWSSASATLQLGGNSRATPSRLSSPACESEWKFAEQAVAEASNDQDSPPDPQPRLPLHVRSALG